MQRPTRSVETLPCKLTDEEFVEKSLKQQSHLSKIEELEVELKGVQKRYKSMIEEEEREVIKLRDQLSSKTEYREVECSITWDFDDKKKKVYHRMDTGKFVREVPISDHELQEELRLREEQEHDAEIEQEIDETIDEANEELLVEEENSDTDVIDD